MTYCLLLWVSVACFRWQKIARMITMATKVKPPMHPMLIHSTVVGMFTVVEGATVVCRFKLS